MPTSVDGICSKEKAGRAVILVCILIILCASAPAQNVSPVEIGLVIPRNVVTGDTISGSIVTNPGDYSGVPVLRVLTGKIPGIAGVAPGDLLSKYSVRIGDESTVLPASRPFQLIAGNQVSIRVFATGGREDNGWQVQIPSMANNQSPAFPPPSGFSVPPINLAGALQIIHGPFSGNSDLTKIQLHDLPARLLAESPRAAFCLIPREVHRAQPSGRSTTTTTMRISKAGYWRYRCRPTA